MMINACLLADKSQKAELARWIAATDSNPSEKIKAVTDIYNQIGVDKMALRRIEEYFEESKIYLDKVKISASRKQPLIDFAHEMMHRQY